VGSQSDCTWILGLPGFRVERMERCGETATSRARVQIERCGRGYPCGGCGRRTIRVRSTTERTWDDLPWAGHAVTLVYRQRRLCCRRCGIRAERVDFADAKARDACASRLASTVSRCRPVMPPYATASAGARRGARKRPFSPTGIARVRGSGHGTSGSTRSTAGKASASGRCSRTSCTAR
jgi:hypothetical protein